MSMPYDKYEVVIGLEIHAQLLTNSKAFSPDPAYYGAPPNTLIDPRSLGHPGILPKLNSKQIEYAVKLGLATGSDIRRENRFSRKNYFYPDLPKGYQITQFDTPICEGGHIDIDIDGEVKSIGLTRIHMEEDSGKSTHDLDPYYSLVDLNRSGVPLLEIVSEPEMRSSKEAYQYLTEFRKLLRYLGICDGNMEEGSMRCDANISVRIKGEKALGEKVEVKNMNSIRNVQRALEYEIIRQIDIIESGGHIDQSTRRFDAVNGKTSLMRMKEDAHDYRYFCEPDLPPVLIEVEYIDKIKKELPSLPRQLQKKYVKEYGLSDYDARVLTDDKKIAEYFESLSVACQDYKLSANWVMGPVKSFLNENAIDLEDFDLDPKRLGALIIMVKDGKLSHSAANQKVFKKLIGTESSPEDLATSMNLIQNMEEGDLAQFVIDALDQFPEKVLEYKNGKKGLLGLFMGEVMKRSKGKADPKKANQILKEKLEE